MPLFKRKSAAKRPVKKARASSKKTTRGKASDAKAILAKMQAKKDADECAFC